MTHRVVLLFFLVCLAGESTAQLYFGRNKIQYAGFDWQVLKTTHFDIYYDEKMEELATIGAAYAEEAYTDLLMRFGEPPGKRVPLIFYSSPVHFEQTNTTDGLVPPGVGGFFEFMKGRVVLPADGNLFRFRHVIRHELVHVFTFNRFNQLNRAHRIPDGRFYPLWFTEGIAEYWSGDPPDVQSRMVIRDAVINGTILVPSQFYRVQGTYYMYKLGEHFLHFLADTYGESVLNRLITNAWKTIDFSESLRLATGRSLSDLDQEWLYWLRTCYWPTGANDPPAVTGSLPVQTRGFHMHPRLRTDSTGTWCYFIGNRTGYTSRYRSPLPDLQTGDLPDEPSLLLQGERTPEVEWIKPFDNGFDIGPDGRIALAVRSGESDVLHLFPADEPDNRETVAFKTLVKITGLNWSPDGNRMVLSALDESGRQDLWIFEPGTRSLTRLTHDYFDERMPVFSPDGSRILFSTDRTPEGEHGALSVAAMPVTGGPVQLLSDPGPFTDLVAGFNRSGDFLFTSDRFGPAAAFSIPWPDLQRALLRDSLTVTARKVTATSGYLYHPVEKEGSVIAAVYEKGGFTIRQIPLTTGTDQIPLRREQALTWKPAVLQVDRTGPVSAYEKSYSLEVAQGAIYTEPLLGTMGGVALAFGDMLGDDRFYLMMYNTAETLGELLENINVSVARVTRDHRLNVAYGGFHFQGRRYDLEDPDVFFRERLIGGFYSFSWPLSRFDRVESSVTLAWSRKESIGYPTLFGGGLYLESGQTQREAWLVSNSIGYVYDNSLWAFTGPLDGYRYGLSLAYTTDVRYNRVNYYSVLADHRYYFRLSDRSNWSSRIQFRMNDGQEARRYFMIGSWDIRGYPNYSIRGRKLWQTNQELRFPLLDNLGLRLPMADINLPWFRGALFADAGNAWDDRYPGTIGSLGGGIRLGLGGALTLRYDTGKTWSENPTNLADGWFHQFFFGWDF